MASRAGHFVDHEGWEKHPYQFRIRAETKTPDSRSGRAPMGDDVAVSLDFGSYELRWPTELFAASQSGPLCEQQFLVEESDQILALSFRKDVPRRESPSGVTSPAPAWDLGEPTPSPRLQGCVP